jgi:O-antigen chain-terminating methyltransferase
LAPGRDELDGDSPPASAQQGRSEPEAAAYAEALAAVDRLADLELPRAALAEVRERLERLNSLWTPPVPPEARGLGAPLTRRVWAVLAPAVARQAEFNATLVQLLNAALAQRAELDERLRQLAAALVRYAQQVVPLVDAADRSLAAQAAAHADAGDRAVAAQAAALSTELVQLRDGLAQARDELAGARRQLAAQSEENQRLLAQRDRLEALSEEVRALRATLSAQAPPPAVAAAAVQAAEESVYTAFENRFRGSREDLRARQLPDAERFRGLSPVVDLGCGRGEFLELLRQTGVAGRGVDGNRNAVLECREKGLDVVRGDIVDFLRSLEDGSVGGVFAAQLVEHLPPEVLAALLAEAHRVLRTGGLLVLETVNVRSATAFLEVYVRDVTHRLPLHPETLAFLVAAHGFADVRVETRAPIPEEGKLRPVPWQELPLDAARVMNENFERLNQLLYGPLDYAVIARR